MKLDFCSACGIKKDLFYYLLPNASISQDKMIITLCDNCFRLINNIEKNDVFYHSGMPQYGYRRVKIKGNITKIEENEEEQEILKKVIKYYNEGLKIVQIRSKLTEENIFNRKGKIFHSTQIKRILEYNLKTKISFRKNKD